MRVTSLRVYPIKSCGSIAVTEARLTSRGFEGDRRWMIVEPDGRFVTQRQTPQLSRIQCAWADGHVRLSASGHRDFNLPVAVQRGRTRSVEVWRDRVTAIEHPDAGAWVSAVIGREVHAVYMPEDAQRAHGDDDGLVSFADGYPYLLTTEASLADLNERLCSPVGMDRFRPNIVVDGQAPYAEDSWPRLTVGAVQFRVAKPCERCVLTTVDPKTGQKGKEPLRTLATYRKLNGAVCFGVNLVALSEGALRIGDDVSIIGVTLAP